MRLAKAGPRKARISASMAWTKLGSTLSTSVFSVSGVTGKDGMY
jgi:hypothetical protein